MPLRNYAGLASLFALLFGLWGHAFAQQSNSIVQAKLLQHLVVQDKEREVLKPVEAVKPGDIIEYRATYTNAGLVSVRNVVADLPVPVGTTYLKQSTQPKGGALVSTANKAFAAEPLLRPNEKGELQPVPLSEYRHIRWLINEIPAGTAVAVVARVQVNSNVAASTQQP